MAGQEMIKLKLRPGDQEKLQRALEAQLAKADANTPIVLAQAGHEGASYCKKKCPVDTGRLRGTIGNPGYINPKQGKGGGIFRFGESGKLGLGGITGIMFGTAVEYAVKVENTHKTKSHYMLRGVTAAIPKMVDILSGVIRG